MIDTQAIDDYLDQWRTNCERDNNRRGFRLYETYKQTKEYYIGQERFLRADLVAWSHKVSAGRFRLWLNKGTPSGEFLRSMQLIVTPHRYYLHEGEYEKVSKGLSALARRSKRPPQPT